MSMLPPVLAECRKLLENVTPLREDCGKLCRCACCSSLQGEETGMLLFPGEEAAYEGLKDYHLLSASNGTLLMCSGHCKRDERPLSCRLFPLLPLLREDGIHIAMDARARAVCPLWQAGRNGLSAEFVEAVRTCGILLSEDAQMRVCLQQLTAEHDELRALQRSFSGR